MSKINFEEKYTNLLVDYVSSKKITNLANYLYEHVINVQASKKEIDDELIKFLFEYVVKARQISGLKFPDLFGDYMCQMKANIDTKGLGQFLTPNSVASLLSKMASGNDFYDPSAGSGRLLLYGIEEYFKQNNSFPNLVISQDLDFECFVYSLMNFWIHQIPNCYSVQANTLTRKHYLSAKTILIDGYIEWQECKDEAMQILNLN